MTTSTALMMAMIRAAGLPLFSTLTLLRASARCQPAHPPPRHIARMPGQLRASRSRGNLP